MNIIPTIVIPGNIFSSIHSYGQSVQFPIQLIKFTLVILLYIAVFDCFILIIRWLR